MSSTGRLPKEDSVLIPAKTSIPLESSSALPVLFSLFVRTSFFRIYFHFHACLLRSGQRIQNPMNDGMEI